MGRDALGKTEFHMGVLYVNNKNLLGDLGVLVKDELGDNAPGFSVGIGIKGVVARVKGNNPAVSDASALALGAMVRYSPPTSPRLGIVGQVYLSPNIVTFGDADRYVETNAPAGVRSNTTGSRLYRLPESSIWHQGRTIRHTR